MRILHLNSHASLEGGVETYLLPILEALRRRGHDVTLLDGRDLAAIEQFKPDVIHVHRVADPRVIETVAKKWPTLAFAHDYFPFACPGDGRFLADKKEICTRAVGPFCLVAPWIQRCGSRRPDVHLERYFAARRAIKKAPRVLVASLFMKKELAKNGINADVVTLPCPVDMFPETAPPLSTATPPLILSVSRLISHKGFDALLIALASCKAPFTAEIVGDGPERARLEGMARDLKLPVTFTPRLSRAQIAERYTAARVIAFPSIWAEPFGLVGLEAMAFARPVVAFDVGGVREWLRDDHTGFAVPRGDTKAFAARLDALLGDAAHAAALGVNGRQILEERFSLRKHLTRLEVIYESVVGTIVDTPSVSLS